MKCYEMYELEFNGSVPQGPYAQADISAEFSNGEQSVTVKGFYDGDGIYKVRFLPVKAGQYTWKVSGIVQGQGQEVCEPAVEKHGMVKAEGNHFVYQDGTKYLPFGTTIYGLVHQTEELIEETMQTLQSAPFNKVRHCVFPKDYDYNHNNPQYYPFEKDADGKWDVHRPCFAYWQHLESIIWKLDAMGIQSDLILFHSYDRWGFSTMEMEECKVYLDYLLRRLSAVPCIWWSLANEYDLMMKYKTEDWYDFENFIAENDPYRHLLSNHNSFVYYDFSRRNVSHCCVQSGELFKAGLWQRKYQKPVIFDEFCYEGDIPLFWGNISAFEMVNRFWKVCAQGGYASHGETYDSGDEILWWSKGGHLKGKSPERIGFLKEVLYSLPSCLEPWDEAFSVDADPEDEEANPMLKIPVFKAFFKLPLEFRENFEFPNKDFTGHCGDEVYLKYYATQCAKKSSIALPNDKEYRVEILDVWNMTKEVLLERSSGFTGLELPGREGIAVLATRIH